MSPSLLEPNCSPRASLSIGRSTSLVAGIHVMTIASLAGSGFGVARGSEEEANGRSFVTSPPSLCPAQRPSHIPTCTFASSMSLRYWLLALVVALACVAIAQASVGSQEQREASHFGDLSSSRYVSLISLHLTCVCDA